MKNTEEEGRSSMLGKMASDGAGIGLLLGTREEGKTTARLPRLRCLTLETGGDPSPPSPTAEL